MQQYFDILYNLSDKAIKKDEVPIAALITYNNRIIAKSYNKRNKSKNVLDHAEIIVIKKAAKLLKDWRLDKCDLYVTMCPCNMCQAIINETRIRNVYYLFENSKQKKNNTSYKQINDISIEKHKKLLTVFFKNKRYKK